MSESEFRKELNKIMPGYSWTVHKPRFKKFELEFSYLEATGTQSSGFNRLSTLSVERRSSKDEVTYHVKSAGFGKRANWNTAYSDSTLARALRGLQDHYKNLAQKYAILEANLQDGRGK